MKEVKKLQPDSCLLLAGVSRNQPRITALVESAGLDNSIRFLGVIPDVRPMLLAADVFLLPSLFEGLPVSCLEAQCAGIPCLVSDTVTREAAVTSLLSYKSLRDPAESWAHELVKMGRNGGKQDSRQASEDLKHAGFDIRTESRRLQEYYSFCIAGSGVSDEDAGIDVRL